MNNRKNRLTKVISETLTAAAVAPQLKSNIAVVDEAIGTGIKVPIDKAVKMNPADLAKMSKTAEVTITDEVNKKDDVFVPRDVDKRKSDPEFEQLNDVSRLIGKKIYASIGGGEEVTVTQDMIDSVGDYLGGEGLPCTALNFEIVMANLEDSSEEERVRNGDSFVVSINDSEGDMLSDMRGDEEEEEEIDEKKKRRKKKNRSGAGLHGIGYTVMTLGTGGITDLDGDGGDDAGGDGGGGADESVIAENKANSALLGLDKFRFYSK